MKVTKATMAATAVAIDPIAVIHRLNESVISSSFRMSVWAQGYFSK
jgi:hypothetical protein